MRTLHVKKKFVSRKVQFLIAHEVVLTMVDSFLKFKSTWLIIILAIFTSPVQSQVDSVAEAEAAYLLDQGDRISIQVFDEPDLTMTALVGASGVINYSYLGDIKVTGKTAQQVERDITTLLQDGYLVNPSVNVSITTFRPFFINGEVRSPGGYAYQPGLTLDKAIALAGGLTDRASRRKMYIVKAANEEQKQVKAKMQTKIAPGDIITIKEGFF